MSLRQIQRIARLYDCVFWMSLIRRNQLILSFLFYLHVYYFYRIIDMVKQVYIIVVKNTVLFWYFSLCLTVV